MRLVFRLVFIASFLSLGVDWARENHPLTTHAAWSDFLGFLGSMGYVSSSALTLAVCNVLSELTTIVQIFALGRLQICFPQLTNTGPKSLTCTSIDKFTTTQTSASSATCPSTSVDHSQIIEIGRSVTPHEPSGCMPSLPTMVVEVAQSQANLPVCRPPPIVLEPNRRRVDPEEEFEVPSSPPSARSHKLAGVFRSLSSKRKC